MTDRTDRPRRPPEALPVALLVLVLVLTVTPHLLVDALTAEPRGSHVLVPLTEATR